MFYDYHSRSSEIFGINEYFNFHNVCIINYYGITQDPTTKDFMIIMDYYSSGDLRHYITNHFDYSCGNILYNNATSAIICDLGISKSSIAADNSGVIYGIIPYIAPEIFQGHNYTTASDIYSFGMMMWEFMTGRRPFWDQNHDIDLIISICDGLRPPITTNILKDYIIPMKKCWHFDPNKRPTASSILKELDHIKLTIYTSRPLSNMIKSAICTNPFYYYQNNNTLSNDNLTREWELDINNMKSNNDNDGTLRKVQDLFTFTF
ncbi:kinase-like domain-containing protein [Rhizophagus diaphanus]|nr:kinase-like domain-containing protein [Rhizophagus diaphanus] [Rhizophagus sp. MUCL 43196]